jgi:hypothetical protein
MSMDTGMRTYLSWHYQEVRKPLYAAAGRHAPSGTASSSSHRSSPPCSRPNNCSCWSMANRRLTQKVPPRTDRQCCQELQGSEGVFVDIASCLAAYDEPHTAVQLQAHRRPREACAHMALQAIPQHGGSADSGNHTYGSNPRRSEREVLRVHEPFVHDAPARRVLLQ